MLILTSWDDGHPEDLRIAALLTKFGLSGTFFVPIENREGRSVLVERELRELDRGFEVGGHTLTHHYLKGIAAEKVRYEIREGKIRVEHALGHEIQGFCYPGGHFNSKIAVILLK